MNMRLNYMLACVILLGFASASYAQNITCSYDLFCLSYQYVQWKIGGIVNGVNQELYVFDCNKIKTYKGEISIPKTDDLLYSLTYTNSYYKGVDSYLNIFDIYGNLVIRELGYGHLDQQLYFSLNHPIDEQTILTYKSNESATNWYSSSYTPTDWNTVASGSPIELENVKQYYRVSFNIQQLNKYAGYILKIFTYGTINAYLNDNNIWNGQLLTTDENNTYARLFLSANLLKETNNLLAISIESDQPIKNYILIQMSLLYANELDNHCALSFIPVTYEASVATLSLRYGYDLIRDTSADFRAKPFTYDAYLPNNTYHQLSYITYYPYKEYGRSPITFNYEGKESQEKDQWDLIDSYADKYFIDLELSSSLSSNTKLYNSYRLDALNSTLDTNSIMITEIYLYTCNLPKEPLTYKHKSYTLYKDYPIEIVPSRNSYSQFEIEPNLPEGLSLNVNTGVITGTPISVFDEITFTVTGRSSEKSSFQFTLKSEECGTSRVRLTLLSRSHTTEIILITDMDTNDVVFSEIPYKEFKSSSYDVYELCLPPRLYNINMYSVEDHIWDQNSFLKIEQYPNQFITMNSTATKNSFYSLIPLYYNRYEEKGSTFRTIDTSFLISGASEWKVLSNSIPSSDWYKSTFDDSAWTNSVIGNDYYEQNIYLFRKHMTLQTLSLYDMINIYICYTSGIIVYINDQEVFRNHFEGELTNESQASESFTEALYRSIVLPSKYFKQGDNIISIAVIPDVKCEVSKYYFDIVVKNIGTGDSPVFYHFPDDDNILFNYRYSSYAAMYIDANVTFASKYGDFAPVTSYAFYGDQSDRPTSWILEGKKSTQSDKEWVIVDERQRIVWPTTKTRLLFYIADINKYHAFDMYRIRNMTYAKSNHISLNQIEFYCNSIQQHYAPMNYTSTFTSTFVNSYLPEITTTSATIYHEYTITPALPKGVEMNPNYGYIRGFATEYSPKQMYTITAKNPMNEIVMQTIEIEIYRCGTNNSYFLLDIFYDYRNKYAQIQVDQGINGDEGSIFKTNTATSFYSDEYIYNENPQVHLYYPFCIHSSYYRVQIGGDDSYGLRFPNGYTITNEVGTIFTSSTLTDNKVKNYVLDLNSPINSNQHSWSYHVDDTLLSDWLNKNFDIGSWSMTTSGNIAQSNKKYLYLRTYFTISDLSSHSSLDFKLVTIGSVTIYLNKEQIYQKTITNNNEYTHIFTFYIQNQAIKNNNNILGIFIEPKERVNTNTFDMDLAYTYGDSTKLLPSFTYSSPSTFSSGYSLDHLFDNSIFTQTEFVSENRIVNIEFDDKPFYFNTLYIQLYDRYFPTSVTVLGRENKEYDWITMVNRTPISGTTAADINIPIPMGVLSFRYLQIEFFSDNTTVPIRLSQLLLSYSNIKTSMCPSLDDFPTVGENEKSYKYCGKGYQGYIQRECDGLKFDEENIKYNCTYLPPKNLHYTQEVYDFYTYVPIDSLIPQYENIITSFTVTPDLPKGLIFNTTTGIISGIPQEILRESHIYKIEGRNDFSSVSITISIIIHSGFCNSFEGYPQTDLFSVVTVPCPTGYYGSITRECIIDQYNNIDWDGAKENCSNILLVVGTCSSVVLVILIIIIVTISCITIKKNKEEIKKLRSHVANSDGVQTKQKQRQASIHTPLQI